MITTDAQVKGLFKRMSEGTPLYIAAQKAGMCENTARKYHRAQKFPNELNVKHDWRTRPDPFVDVWPGIEAILKDSPALEAKTAFALLQREHPGRFQDGQIRTLQRRFRQWRAEQGPGKEVFFPQDHHAAVVGASDFTDMSSLEITITGVPFEHLIYHYVLTWSNWEHGTVCFSESFESLSTGLQNAWWHCGGVPQCHRTDRLSAAVNNLDEKRAFTRRYDALMSHYAVAGHKTNPNSGNENGDVEQRHYRLKKAVEQALILRGSKDFASRHDYQRFLDGVFEQLNAGRRERFEQERKRLQPLPACRLPDYTELRGVLVGQASTITVRKKVYSVHSRLRDEHVDVRLYAEHLEIRFGTTIVERLPRLCGNGDHRINYRHVIDWLVRKPGAFANYRYRADLFPTSHFRIAYDQLREAMPARADKEYLQILYCAAYQSEVMVNRALQQLIAEGAVPDAAAIKALVHWFTTVDIPPVNDAHVAPVELSHYDSLLSYREVAE